MNAALLVLNAGSSSLKFAVYPADREANGDPLCRGLLDGIGGSGQLRVFPAANAPASRELEKSEQDVAAEDHRHALYLVLDWLERNYADLKLVAAGHRVVHGGMHYSAPVMVDEAVLGALESLIPLSPLHQPHSLAGIRALAALRPGLPHVACFDTAFHRTMPDLAQRFALPRELVELGIRRYGFHGLSYEYIAARLPDYLADGADGRVVVAHLGNGASLCAMRGRRSIETSMSFTPLDGIPMGTRCGALDPGVLLYLMREQGMDEPALSNLLHYRSGLLGLSGLSGDVRELLHSDRPEAAQALDLFTYRIAQAVAGLAAALGGLDALVFTAGIGEHAAPVRLAICQRLDWLGLSMDEAANARQGPRISKPDSRVSAWMIPTDEESVIARHTRAFIGHDAR
ncbi:MAG TPA: acetate/propionate family kinase [Thiobacillaceae bacterium]|nr:acetate/propionate family kinase [Thiobacillaceae bacterium]